MKHAVISAVLRPHILDGTCWCGPRVICECCGSMAHNDLELLPDVQFRMAVFSDQRVPAPV